MKKISKKTQGEAVKTLIQYMIDLWEQHGTENLDVIFPIIHDTFWTASRIAARYDLKEMELLNGFRTWINANYSMEGYRDRI